MPIDAQIRQKIKQYGHLKIDEMMELAMSATPASYYKSKDTIGDKGDFITAPEISQLFGETIALWVIEQWHKLGKPDNFIFLEMGPGQGTLMNDILRTVCKVEKDFFKAINLQLLEINPFFRQKQQDLLAKYGKNINWLDKKINLPKLPIITIANEFFDALPIKQYKKVKNEWREVVIKINPHDQNIRFNTNPIRNSLQQQFKMDHKNAKDGAYIEESFESLAITKWLATHLKEHKGACLFIDYGYNKPPSIRQDFEYGQTLQAISNHKYTPVLQSLGSSDLTAHVDFFALQKASKQKGEKDFNFTTQAEFLKKYGINIRLNQLKQTVSTKDYIILQKQLDRLTNNEQMGELFKVLEIAEI